MSSTLDNLLRQKQNVPREAQEQLAQTFFEIDKKVFQGRLFEYGVKLEFRPAISTKLGLYRYSEKVITIYNHHYVESMKFTLAHEMVHAYAGMTGGFKHGHDTWFWFTLGQVCHAMNIQVNPVLIHSL